MERYPTRNGIAIPPIELGIIDHPYEKTSRKFNNHHHHYSGRSFERSIATIALRDLERHQTIMPVKIHRRLHDTFLPPDLATDEQAAREVIDAYDRGEQFKIYDSYAHYYFYKDIPQDLVDGFVGSFGIRQVFDMAAD